MKTDRISFTSKIHFVDLQTFYNVRKGRYIDHTRLDTSVFNANDFYIEAVRTCSAGGLRKTITQENLGYHIFDDVSKSAPIEYIATDMFSKIENPDRALLLGGKDLRFGAKESMKRFYELRSILLERVKNVTVFEEHAFPDSESNLCYINQDDSWYINTIFKDYALKTSKYSVVDSLENLFKAFKHVFIAEGDSLYINGNEVL